ncbi:MAG: 30S ribosomal protein S20 [bacterium]
MPVKKFAEKALRQSKKAMVRNLKVNRTIKDLTKKALKSIDAKNIEEAKEHSSGAIKAIDKAIQKKIMKKNTGARQKSALMKKINNIK